MVVYNKGVGFRVLSCHNRYICIVINMLAPSIAT